MSIVSFTENLSCILRVVIWIECPLKGNVPVCLFIYLALCFSTVIDLISKLDGVPSWGEGGYHSVFKWKWNCYFAKYAKTDEPILQEWVQQIRDLPDADEGCKITDRIVGHFILQLWSLVLSCFFCFLENWKRRICCSWIYPNMHGLCIYLIRVIIAVLWPITQE